MTTSVYSIFELYRPNSLKLNHMFFRGINVPIPLRPVNTLRTYRYLFKLSLIYS